MSVNDVWGFAKMILCVEGATRRDSPSNAFDQHKPLSFMKGISAVTLKDNNSEASQRHSSNNSIPCQHSKGGYVADRGVL